MNKFLLAFVAFLLSITSVQAQKYSGGVRDHVQTFIDSDTIYASKTLYDNIKELPNFSIATQIMELTAVQQDILALEMCTIFVPSNAAFDNYSKKELAKLITASNSEALKSAFLSHIVMGRIDKHSMSRMLQVNDNSAILRSPGTIDPEAVANKNDLYLTVPNGPKARFSHTNLLHKQGIFHVVDAFLMPAKSE